MKMNFSTENIISIVAVCVGICSLLLSRFMNKRTLDNANELNDKTLKQSEKNLLIQLHYEDRKKALFRLNEILHKNKTYSTLKKEVVAFLDSLEGQFIPVKTKGWVYTQVKMMDEYIKNNNPDEPYYDDVYMAYKEKEIDRAVNEMEEYYANLKPFEKFNYDFSEKIDNFKSGMSLEINERLKKTD